MAKITANSAHAHLTGTLPDWLYRDGVFEANLYKKVALIMTNAGKRMVAVGKSGYPIGSFNVGMGLVDEPSPPHFAAGVVNSAAFFPFGEFPTKNAKGPGLSSRFVYWIQNVANIPAGMSWKRYAWIVSHKIAEKGGTTGRQVLVRQIQEERQIVIPELEQALHDTLSGK